MAVAQAPAAGPARSVGEGRLISTPTTISAPIGCPFCAIAQGLVASRTPAVLFQDSQMVAFEDRDPAALKHYLVIPVRHVRNVAALEPGERDHALVTSMLELGQSLVHRDAPQASSYRFGFHRPPFNSVDHLHLHCIALPYRSWWRAFKYMSLGGLGSYVHAEKVLHQLHPASA